MCHDEGVVDVHDVRVSVEPEQLHLAHDHVKLMLVVAEDGLESEEFGVDRVLDQVDLTKGAATEQADGLVERSAWVEADLAFVVQIVVELVDIDLCVGDWRLLDRGR